MSRGDYKELVELVLIFCGGAAKSNITFKSPGAVSNARWMMKAIYCLKLYLFRGSFCMSDSELQGVTNVALFVALVYLKPWIEAPLSLHAPRNDLNFMKRLEEYCKYDKKVGEVALHKMSEHLWYLSELSIALSFFDDGVSTAEKSEMVQHLQQVQNTKSLKKLSSKEITFSNRRLANSVTMKTLQFFTMLGIDSSFLHTDPSSWQGNKSYQQSRIVAESLVSVNDCAERGIGLIKEFNETLTKDEDQQQFLLLVVDAHRRAFSDCNKMNF